MKKVATLLLAGLLLAGALGGCGKAQDKVLVMADPGWDSIRIQNCIVGLIATSAYGYSSWEEITGSSPVTVQGMAQGEVDVYTELWTDNVPAYEPDVAAGRYTVLGLNYDDNNSGLYVPRYVIEGDPARGIEPMAPDLKSVADLARYPHVFPSDSEPGKGRVYGSVPGWEVDETMYGKYLHYGLDQNFEYFRPGSDSAAVAAFDSAYGKGEGVVGYYWEPSWLMAKYDFVLLEEAPFTNFEEYMAGKTACRKIPVMVCVSNDFVKEDPEFCEFLKNYQVSGKLVGEALLHMQNSGATNMETAVWLLEQNDELIDRLLTPDKAELVRKSLENT